MSNDAVGRLTRLSSNSRYYFNRFQKFFLIAWLISVGEVIAVATTVLITRPNVSSPFFYVPISILVFRVNGLFAFHFAQEIVH